MLLYLLLVIGAATVSANAVTATVTLKSFSSSGAEIFFKCEESSTAYWTFAQTQGYDIPLPEDVKANRSRVGEPLPALQFGSMDVLAGIWTLASTSGLYSRTVHTYAVVCESGGVLSEVASGYFTTASPEGDHFITIVQLPC